MIPDEPAPGPLRALEGPDGWTKVGCYATERAASEHGLVVLAMRLGYRIEPRGAQGYALYVAAGAAQEVRSQLALYDLESRDWPPRLPPLSKLRFAWAGPLGWALITMGVFKLQLRWPGRLEQIGALRADALFGAGEWWRPLTALLLHADIAHLVANLGSGFFLFGLVMGGLGAARGGLALGAAAVAGNILAALLHPGSGQQSFGASTAVFGALGLLTGAAVREVLRRDRPRGRRALLVPILSGGSLLALYGAGGLRTDVIAHATGFAAGCLLGFVARPTRAAGPDARS